jgi:hypothetical protein
MNKILRIALLSGVLAVSTTPLFADPGGVDPPPPPGNGGGQVVIAVVVTALSYLGL